MTQEEYSALSDRDKFLLAVNAFKATCNVLFNCETQIDITIGAVPLQWLSDLSQNSLLDIRKTESAICGDYFTLDVTPDSKEDLFIRTLKL